MAQTQRRLSSQLLLGAVVALVGLVLLADTTGAADTGVLYDYIPLLFILVGVYALIRSGFRNIFGPLVVIIIASVWQLTTLDIIAASDVVSLWPLFIVLFGLSLILSQFRSPPARTVASHVTGFGIFGGSEKRATTERFTGANLTAIFGGVELDLRDAAVAERPAHVSTIALFGGVEVYVPSEWNVDMDVLPLFGGASDERLRRDPEDNHEELDLVVSGFAAFGGVSVKD